MSCSSCWQTSLEQSHECFQKELDGCWFDYIPDACRNEWTSCKTGKVLFSCSWCIFLLSFNSLFLLWAHLLWGEIDAVTFNWKLLFLCLNSLNSKKGDEFFQFHMPYNVSEFILNSVLFILMYQLLRNHANVKILFLHYSLLLTSEALMVYYATLHQLIMFSFSIYLWFSSLIPQKILLHDAFPFVS